MKMRDLLEGMPLTRFHRDAWDLEIENIATSPMQATKSSLYVACKTAIANGRYGMETAYARGCRAFLCAGDAYPGKDASVFVTSEPERLLGELAARIYGYPARGMSVLGITGSTGKTSVALQTVQVLRGAGRAVSALTSDGLDLLGTRTNPGAIVPDAACVQAALAQMAAVGTEIAVLELSSYQLSHFAAESIPFLGVLLTNLSVRHVGRDEHESFAAYADAKLSLLHAPSAFCVLPAEQALQTAARQVRLGIGGDLWVENVQTLWPLAKAPQVRFALCSKEERIGITLPASGDFAAENALCTAALCRVVGLSASEIAAGLSRVSVTGRMECISARHERLIYLDAAFMPQDLECALKALRPLAKGRLCVLFGSVGGRAKERRVALTRVAECFADRLYLCADDPDTENPASICEEMNRAMREPLRATVLPDRREAILRAVREMRPGDLLLILAKPYPAGQLVGGRFLAFDERSIVREALAQF